MARPKPATPIVKKSVGFPAPVWETIEELARQSGNMAPSKWCQLACIALAEKGVVWLTDYLAAAVNSPEAKAETVRVHLAEEHAPTGTDTGEEPKKIGRNHPQFRAFKLRTNTGEKGRRAPLDKAHGNDPPNEPGEA